MKAEDWNVLFKIERENNRLQKKGLSQGPSSIWRVAKRVKGSAEVVQVSYDGQLRVTTDKAINNGTADRDSTIVERGRVGWSAEDVEAAVLKAFPLKEEMLYA